MNKTQFVLLGVILPLSALLGACGSRGDITSTGGATTDYYVDATSGSDSNAGTSGEPFKTITKAVSVATSGQVISVRPGIYDAANGEVFPIVLGDSVSLTGDEANKGQGGTTPTEIIGGGLHSHYTTWGTTIEPGTGATIAGFVLTNDNPTGTPFPMTLIVDKDNLTLRNNHIINGLSTGVYVTNSSQHDTIEGNVIADNTNDFGLGFIGGGAGSIVENNVITGNHDGVEYDSPGGDMGGGPSGSTGGNVISCNLFDDLWTNSAITIDAQGNSWDHSPPTFGCDRGDVCDFSGTATINTAGSSVASNPCS